MEEREMTAREMTAREYLDQIRVLNTRIQNLIQEKEAIWEGALPGGTCYRERVQSSPDPDPCASWYCTLEAKEEEINQKIDELVSVRHEIVQRISELDDPRYIRLLYLRYVQLKKFREIADEMGYTCQYTLILHKDALKVFEKRFNKILYHLISEM